MSNDKLVNGGLSAEEVAKVDKQLERCKAMNQVTLSCIVKDINEGRNKYRTLETLLRLLTMSTMVLGPTAVEMLYCELMYRTAQDAVNAKTAPPVKIDDLEQTAVAN